MLSSISVSFPYAAFLFSRQYLLAMTAAVAEYLIESALTPTLKHSTTASVASWIGLLIVVLGEGLRKTAIITAKTAFTHQIQHKRRSSHVLVTSGVYRFVTRRDLVFEIVCSSSVSQTVYPPVSRTIHSAGFATQGTSGGSYGAWERR